MKNPAAAPEAPPATPATPATPPTAFTEDNFSGAYPPGIQRHYWNRARNQIIYRLARRLVGPEESVLDVGCGTGLVTAYLRERGMNCHGCDLGVAPPCDAETARHLSLGVDACDLDPALRSRVGLILLLDVLEHLESPRDALARLRDAFPSLRHVLFTVPARMDLWSNYDQEYRHYLRYDGRTVKDLAAPGRFELTEWSYFFHALYFPARIMKLMGVKRQTQLKAPAAGMAERVHGVIASAFVAEWRLLPARFPGSSIHGVLRCLR